jgi:hypothetical protein
VADKQKPSDREPAPAEGTIDAGGSSIRYVDVRACEPQSALAEMFGVEREKCELRGVVIAAPQLLFEVALNLSARSLFLPASERTD